MGEKRSPASCPRCFQRNQGSPTSNKSPLLARPWVLCFLYVEPNIEATEPKLRPGVPLRSRWLVQTNADRSICRHRVIHHGEMSHVIILSFSTQVSQALIAVWGFSISDKLPGPTKIAERQPRFGLQHLRQIGTSRAPLRKGNDCRGQETRGHGKLLQYKENERSQGNRLEKAS